jgi:6-phosphogluconolactonase
VEDYSRQVTICSDLADLSRQAAAQFVSLADRAVQERGRFTVCLSGGSTPRQTYALLADDPLRNRTPWSRVHIFWGDERLIALDQPDNHYRMASDIFLMKVPIPAQNIHRVRVEVDNPAQAASEYDGLLRSFFDLTGEEIPRFDLIILGMGADGHMASLFPGTPALKETERLAVANYVPKLNADRLTLTLPVLNNARQIMFLVSGDNKADALRGVLEDDSRTDLPARLLRPRDGKMLWMVDNDAAGKLENSTLTLSPEVPLR